MHLHTRTHPRTIYPGPHNLSYFVQQVHVCTRIHTNTPHTHISHVHILQTQLLLLTNTKVDKYQVPNVWCNLLRVL